jgi:hypothetical protein
MTAMRFTLIIFSVLFFIGGYGQMPDQAKTLLPVILPASPEAAGIAKFGNYEVNMNSGIPNISIPLYEIQVGELKVPISINYHASGVKVTDNAAWTGLGWSLSAGGTISRRIMGRPDELQGGYLSGSNPAKITSNINPYSNDDLLYLQNILDGIYDVEPDIYSYNMPGKGGKFLFDQTNGFTPIILPYDPVKITRTQTGLSTQKFSVLDESGRQYIFDIYEWTSLNTTNDAASTWMLTMMISANKQDTIYFNYTPKTGAGITDFNLRETIVVNDNITNSTSPPKYTDSPPAYFEATNSTTTIWQLHKEILFKNGKVVFEQALEARQETGMSVPNRLSTIRVYSGDPSTNSYLLIKTIKFFHSYFINPSDQYKRLRLDSIAIMNSSETESEKYKFDYNTTLNLPSKSAKSVDHWGYFNGSQYTGSRVPRMTIPFVSLTGSTNVVIGSNNVEDRDPNPAFMQANVLNKITYPTGGHTIFEYETNQYLDASVVKYAGGLRVKSIKSYDGITANPVTKTYKYGDAESGNGRANFILNNYFFQNEQQNQYNNTPVTPLIASTKRVRTFMSNPTNDLEPYDGTPVSYATVTEYIGDGINNIGKTIYQYNDRPDAMSLVAGMGKPMISTYHIGRGQLVNKEVYRKDIGNNYTKLATTANIYEAFPEQWYPNVGLVVFKSIITDGPTGQSHLPANCCGNNGLHDSQSWRYSNYSVRSGDNRLIQTTETLYDPDNITRSITNTKKYFYEDFNHQQVTRIETTNSDGEIINDILKYPHSLSTTAPYNTMITANIINKVIEEVKTSTDVTTVQLNQQKNNYANWLNNNFLPQTLQIKVKGNAIETRANFLKYDIRGNVLEMQKTGDAKSAYVWDYLKMYPVAEVKGADEAQIAYTSFEADGKGSWTFTGRPVLNEFAPTGRKIYSLTPSTAITRTGLTSTVTYVISYWSTSASALTITGAVAGYPISGRTLNGWKYYEHRITGQTTVSISGTTSIDELRMYPLNAFMSTNTYDPLIGITTQCDVNNRISYYEYDGFNRLMLVRDQDKNIIKKLCYNYFGQVENCSTFYNVAITRPYNKSNCAAGSYGSVVNFTVPANLFSGSTQAEANAKATAYADAYGPANANVLGTCLTCGTCSGVDKKCVNGVCETGLKITTNQFYDSVVNKYVCTYHYEWSDGTWSQDYVEYTTFPCMVL